MADLVIVSSDKLTLSLYFSQQAEILQSIELVNITFSDQDNQVLNLTTSEYTFSAYSLSFKFDYQMLEFMTVYLTIPYLASEESEQAISASEYVASLYFYNDYSQQKDSLAYRAAAFIPLVVAASLLVLILLNILVKTSHFLQLLDMMQLIAATLYL